MCIRDRRSMLQTRNDACFFEVNGSIWFIWHNVHGRQPWFVLIWCIGDILGHYQVRSPRMRRHNVESAYYCSLVLSDSSTEVDWREIFHTAYARNVKSHCHSNAIIKRCNWVKLHRHRYHRKVIKNISSCEVEKVVLWEKVLCRRKSCCVVAYFYIGTYGPP